MRDIIVNYGFDKPKSNIYGSLIAIDINRHMVVNPPRLPLFRRRCRYVSIKSGVTSERDITRIAVQDIKGRTLAIVISYQVRCEPGNEPSTALALAGNGDEPQEAFERLLESWVCEFADSYDDGRQDFIDNFEYAREGMGRYLKEKAQSTVGLDLNLDLIAEGESDVDTIQISDFVVSARPHDGDENIDFRIAVDLEVADGGRIKAVVGRQGQKEFEEIIRRVVRETIRRSDLDDLYFNFDSKVRPGLRRTIDDAVAPEGRHLASFSVRRDNVDQTPKQVVEIDMPLKIPLREAPATVAVTHRMRLNLNSITNFRLLNIPPKEFKDWVEERLTDASRNVLFNKAFADLVKDFDLDEAAVGQAINKTMAEAGYDVKMYMILPELEAVRLQKDGFEFAIKGDFSTSDPRVSAGVNIAVRGRIPDLAADAIQRRLKPPSAVAGTSGVDTSLSQEIVRAATNAVQWSIHRLRPDLFYRYFDVPYASREIEQDDSAPKIPLLEGDTVNAFLRREVEAALRKEFAAGNIEVLPRIDQNDLTRRIVQLCQGQRTLEIDVVPVADGGDAYPVTFQVRYKIDGLVENGWSAFQSNAGFAEQTESGDIDISREVAEITGALEQTVRDKLRVVPAAALHYRDYATKKKIDALIESDIKDCAASGFGLNIQVISIGREMTDEEAYRSNYRGEAIQETEELNSHNRDMIRQSQVASQRQLHEMSEQIQKLREERTGLLASVMAAEEEDRIEMLDEEIKSLEAERKRLVSKVRNTLPVKPNTQSSDAEFDFDSMKGNGAPKIEPPPPTDDITPAVEVQPEDDD